MNWTEIIGIVIGSSAVNQAVTYFTNKKSADIDNGDKLFNSLNERINKLEEKVCFKKDCKDRI